jgi:hypothetical protein
MVGCAVTNTTYNEVTMKTPIPLRLSQALKNLQYTRPEHVIYEVPLDVGARLYGVTSAENGGYEWAIVTDKIIQHSDCGYGRGAVALRDGLICYEGLFGANDYTAEIN